MKKLYFGIVTAALVGIGFRYIYWPASEILLILGFGGLAIFHSRRLFYSFSRSIDLRLDIQELLIIGSSITIIAKYNLYYFWDWPSLFIAPAFILSSAYYFIFAKNRTEVSLTSLLILILLLPLFGISIPRPPRSLVQFGNAYDVTNNYIDYSYDFKSDEARIFYLEAKESLYSGDYHRSIKLNQEAIALESDNPEILIDLAHGYSYIEEFEEAIECLSMAIEIDPSFSLLFNNRGLIYYKTARNNLAVHDFLTAIELNPWDPVPHANIALAYYFLEEYEKSCLSLNTAASLGLDLTQIGEMKEKITSYCN